MKNAFQSQFNYRLIVMLTKLLHICTTFAGLEREKKGPPLAFGKPHFEPCFAMLTANARLTTHLRLLSVIIRPRFVGVLCRWSKHDVVVRFTIDIQGPMA